MSNGFKQEQPKGWFERLIVETLERYANNVSAERLAKKYPGLPKNIIAERYIRQQARVAALAGGASALVVSGAVALSGFELVSTVGIPALAITVPVGVLAFGGELAYTLRLQIKTAFDLCNLYGVSVNPNDPEDLQQIFALGMGMKAGELTANAFQKIAPGIVTQQTRSFLRTGIRRGLQEWASKNLSRDFARRYLAEGFLLKAIVPGFSVVLGAGWNYLSTVSIGQAVQVRVRSRGLSIEYINEIPLSANVNPNLILATALVILTADDRIQENEIVAYSQLANRLRELHPDFVPENIEGQWIVTDEWLAQTTKIEDSEAQQTIYSTAETIAILDGQLGRSETKLLKRMAKLFGLKYDENRLKARAKPFYAAPAGRGCRFAALVIAIILLLAVCACSVSAFLVAGQFIAK